MTKAQPRDFTFEPTEAVATSRERGRYISCPACHEDRPIHLFYRTGVRFVRCGGCGVVYLSPTTQQPRSYFDIEEVGQHKDPKDRDLLVRNFERMLALAEETFSQETSRTVRRSLLIGRTFLGLSASGTAQRLHLTVVNPAPADWERMATEGDLDWLRSSISPELDMVILNEVLEACEDAATALERLSDVLPDHVMIVIVFGNTATLSARVLRRYWPRYFAFKSAYYTLDHIDALAGRVGLDRVAHHALSNTYRLGYIRERFARSDEPRALARLGEDLRVQLPSGLSMALFHRRTKAAAEKLSIIVPVYNEVRFVGDVLDALLAKRLPIDRELIIVESNSSDGSREVVERYRGRPDVTILLEDRPQGKGHAVRTGLAIATGSIVLIQDADFEYDLDDYEMLLQPILQRKTSFVLGSRSLGLDDWKVRRYASSPFKGFLMNAAQVAFARTFNFLYRQRVTDVNTMFKVFRTNCLDGVTLVSDGFALDIELVCRIVRAGYAPLEVPVNYVSRGFDEGKKVNFLLDAWPSYWAFFRFRFAA